MENKKPNFDFIDGVSSDDVLVNAALAIDTLMKKAYSILAAREKTQSDAVPESEDN